jgi:hypothetical protein
MAASPPIPTAAAFDHFSELLKSSGLIDFALCREGGIGNKRDV